MFQEVTVPGKKDSKGEIEMKDAIVNKTNNK